MKKFSTLFLVAAVALVGMFAGAKKAEAVPAFARQVGVPCYSCHYQHFPKLNAFGREFKLGGYSQSAQELISDEHLSIPPVLNAGFMAKFSYETVGSPKKGEWQVPGDAALFVGGRIGENMGTFTELSPRGELANIKFVYSKDLGGLRAGLGVAGTDGMGAGATMEPFNTGVSGQLGWENSDVIAPSLVRSGSTGIGVFVTNELFFVNVGLTAPVYNAAKSNSADISMNFAQHIRAAITPKVADGLDLMVGVDITSGEVKSTAGTSLVKMGSTVIDFQIQTEVSGMTLEVSGGMATKSKDWNGSTNDAKATGVSATLGLMKGAGVKAAFATFDTGAATKGSGTSMGFGGYYAIAQNAELILELVSIGGDAKTALYDSSTRLTFAYAF